MKTIQAQLSALSGQVAGAYEANFFPREIALHQRIYRTLMSDMDALQHAMSEGVFEVVLRSRSNEIVINVDEHTGLQVALDLNELVGERANRAAAMIVHTHELLAKEGESTERIDALALLLTPVGTDGMPLAQPAPVLAEGERCPFLPEATAKVTVPAPTRRRQRTA